jgi:hypothetical protein
LVLHNNPQISSAAVTLQLSQRGIGSDEMHKIAQDVIDKCGYGKRRIMTALEIYENNQMENPSGILFLQELLAGLPLSFIEERQKVTRILMELLGRRVASLSDRQVWEQLRLPAGLFSLIHN